MAKNRLRSEELLCAIDTLISKYGALYPDLERDLRLLRSDLEIALKQRDHHEVALVALRVASWVRYFIELIARE